MEGQYLDEVILKSRQERKNERLTQYLMRQDALPKGFFQKVSICGGMAEIMLPAGLQRMSGEWIEKRYQFDPPPQIVLTSPGREADFTLSVIEEVAIPGEELPNQVELIMEGVRRYLPSVVFLQKGQEQVRGIEVCWFSYAGNTFDGGKRYYFLAYAATEKTTLLTMNCRYEQQEKWDAVTRICIRSLTGKVCHG